MEFIRIGDKVISPAKIHRLVDRVLEFRREGLSQQEAAVRLGVDRSFVSRLESLGEVRKGSRLALVGFPVANGRELAAVAAEEGVEFVLLMSEAERWRYVEQKSGAELVNEFMDLASRLEGFDAVIFIGSDRRVKMVEAILGPRVLGWELGPSPLREDRPVDPEKLRALIRQVKGGRGEGRETG